MEITKQDLFPVFIGHGSPMNAISVNDYTRFLNNYGSSIKIPRAIVVISAHWQTKGTFITGNDHPEQIYDFYGFPDELYNVKYAPSGSGEIAKLISKQITDISIDEQRGVDHAGWAVVKHMFPEQNVPLLEMSLDVQKSPAQHFALGEKLVQLTQPDLLFIGSGNLVHNLREVSFNSMQKPFPWAIKADKWFAEALIDNQFEQLIDYENTMPDYRHSIPTTEHYLPLLYILGMHNRAHKIKTLFEEIQNGSISMRCIQVVQE